MNQNSKELIKLEYEHYKTYTFAIFASLLIVAFGILSNFSILITDYLLIIIIIGCVFILLLIGCWILLGRMEEKFKLMKSILIKEMKTINK